MNLDGDVIQNKLETEAVICLKQFSFQWILVGNVRKQEIQTFFTMKKGEDTLYKISPHVPVCSMVSTYM